MNVFVIRLKCKIYFGISIPDIILFFISAGNFWESDIFWLWNSPCTMIKREVIYRSPCGDRSVSGGGFCIYMCFSSVISFRMGVFHVSLYPMFRYSFRAGLSLWQWNMILDFPWFFTAFSNASNSFVPRCCPRNSGFTVSFWNLAIRVWVGIRENRATMEPMIELPDFASTISACLLESNFRMWS